MERPLRRLDVSKWPDGGAAALHPSVPGMGMDLSYERK